MSPPELCITTSGAHKCMTALQVCAQGLVPPACDELVAQYVHAGRQSTAGLADAKHYLGQVAYANISDFPIVSR